MGCHSNPAELRIRWALSDAAMYGAFVGFAPGRLHFDIPRDALLANFSLRVPANKNSNGRTAAFLASVHLDF